MELRMYFFVPYNISPIQQAIQAGHSMGEYALKYGRYNPDHVIWDFLEKWKTWIILNGGTTNSTRDFNLISTGSLNQIADQLSLGDGIGGPIEFAYFQEPDIENALTAVCFIVQEPVFNYEDYPEFYDWIINQDIVDEDEKLTAFTNLKGKTSDELRSLFPGMYPLWVSFMGGEDNVFLRNLLRGKKLA